MASCLELRASSSSVPCPYADRSTVCSPRPAFYSSAPRALHWIIHLKKDELLNELDSHFNFVRHLHNWIVDEYLFVVDAHFLCWFVRSWLICSGVSKERQRQALRELHIFKIYIISLCDVSNGELVFNRNPPETGLWHSANGKNVHTGAVRWRSQTWAWRGRWRILGFMVIQAQKFTRKFDSCWSLKIKSLFCKGKN